MIPVTAWNFLWLFSYTPAAVALQNTKLHGKFQTLFYQLCIQISSRPGAVIRKKTLYKTIFLTVTGGQYGEVLLVTNDKYPYQKFVNSTVFIQIVAPALIVTSSLHHWELGWQIKVITEIDNFYIANSWATPLSVLNYSWQKSSSFLWWLVLVSACIWFPNNLLEVRFFSS